MPVNSIASPCSSAAAITSSSRTLPPGCTSVRAPASASTSTPSRNTTLGMRFEQSLSERGAGSTLLLEATVELR